MTRSQKREAFVTALLTAPTLTAAARAAGLSERTARRWRTHPEVVAALAAARREVLAAGLTRVVRASTRAARALERALTCGQPATEVSAAKAILDAATRSLETLDLEARVAGLEAALGAAGDGDEEEAWH